MYRELEKKLDICLTNALKNKVFSGCSVGIFKVGKKRIEKKIYYYGENQYGIDAVPVDEWTIFDLASLTKPLVTALCILALVEEGKVALEDRLKLFFNQVSGAAKDIKILQLLNHTSGFPAHCPYYLDLLHLEKEYRFDQLEALILEEKIIYAPGTMSVYSDLGYILLGRIIEKITGESLDSYWSRKIIVPLQLVEGLFFTNNRNADTKVYATTGNCIWSKKPLSGTVHDDNCRAVGGVAGHAGLFGTTTGLLSFCENVFLLYKGLYQHPSISSYTFKQHIDNKVMDRRFGFDIPTGDSSSSGRYYSDCAIGHLGFTGTSFWLDLIKGIGIVFLTNRVYCGEELDSLKKLRPLVHDTIIELL